MSDILDLLLNNTDHTSEPSAIADDIMPVIISTNDLLKFEDINIISDYNTSENLGNDINSRFTDIDTNFKRIIQSDYLRGKSGANYVTKHIYFAKKDPNRIENTDNNYKNPILYNPVIKNGSPDPIQMTNEYIVKSVHNAILSSHGINISQKLWDTSAPELKYITTPDGSKINWHDNIASGDGNDYNIFTFITEDNNGSLYAYSSLVYIFTDKRFEYITDSNKEQYNGLVDLSCAIYFTYKNTNADSYSGNFVTVNSFPTLSYNNSDGNFYWKIYGNESGLLAQGPKGDTTSNALVYCTYSNPVINEGEIRDYVIIEDVLVTFIDKETSKEVTKFVNIDEAIQNKYIDLDIVKNELNHIKICAFCVPHAINNATRGENGEDIIDTEQQIIAGTICYSNSISKSTDGKYIVRFNENLSFNHLFNQHNFFNTMLRNYHNGESNNLKNGYGLMFIPMDSCGSLADQDTAAHTIIPGYSVDENLIPNDKANILNILPIKNINNDDVRSKLADKTNLNAFTDNIDDILMSNCPMDIYYKVRMINQPLVFKTSKVNISDTLTETEESYKVDYNILNNRAAQFDITYKPEGEKTTHFSGTKYNINPILDIEYTWDNDESIINKDNISKDQINVRPKLGLNGIALYLKHKDSLNQSVLDFIKDGVNDISDNRGDSQYNHKLKYINKENNENYKTEFHLNLITGAINQNEQSYISTPYANYISNRLIYFPDQTNNSEPPYKTYKNNIYPYGAVYPNRVTSTWNNTTKYRLYDTVSLYADDVQGQEDSNLISININNPTEYNNNFKCPVFSIYRDYRTGYKLETTQKTQTNNIEAKIHEYNRVPINAIQSHPLDYVNNDNIGNQDNIRSHEGVVYPHKLLLTDSANKNDQPNAADKWQGHIIDSEQTSTIHNFENYGAVIAYIEAPQPDESGGIILNNAYLNDNEWDLKIKFNENKLIAPIINIRSNAIASPGTDFMRLRAWTNDGSWYNAYNLINTCLSINQVSHSLMYRFIYQYNQDGITYRGKTNKQRLTHKTIQDIQTGICGNINSNFLNGDKSIKSNMPLVGHLCNPNLMSRAGYPITTADPANILASKEYKGLGGRLNGGNGDNAADEDHLPWSTTSLINQFSNRVNPHEFCKYYSHNSMCTPIDTMYNISEYDVNYDGVSYRGNDGYRTITLPYHPGDKDYTIRLNKSVITDIQRSIINGKADVEEVVNNSRIVIPNPSPNPTIDSLKIIGVEIIYNCEVLFDTLLDVISGVAQRRDDKGGGINNAWRRSDGLNLRICDAIPHSKFIKHDISTQIGNTYASSGDIDGCNLSNFKLGTGVNEYYSGYRGQIDYLGKWDESWKIIGSGYYYATMYDLDSYYNRSFMNPYYIYKQDKYNFSSVLDQESYIQNGQYIYPKGSKRHLQNSDQINKVATNHPPYFVGVGLIEDNNNILSIYKEYKNKGIIYLCHKDDTAYEKTYTTGEFYHAEDGSVKGIQLRNDVINKDNCSPFVREYIKSIGDQDLDVTDDANKDKIYLWYPMSTDIFNNPYMFNGSEEADISNKHDNLYITKPNYKPLSNGQPSDDGPLSKGFDLDKIKLAFRKCNVKTTSNGYYNGHNIEYGDLDGCKISMLDSSQDSDIVTVTKFISEQSQALSYSSTNNNNNFTQNNTVNANICNDGIVWKDNSSNYVAIHMTGNVDDYQNVCINKEFANSDNTSPEQIVLAGSNGLPQTYMYISKNGSKAMYKVDFTKLLFAAGRLCEAMGITNGSEKIELITDGDLDELIEQSKQNNT